MTIYPELEIAAAALRVGQTTRMRCPACTRADGFVLTRTSPYAAEYICHRASCDFRGRLVLPIGRLHPAVEAELARAPPTAYSGPLNKVDAESPVGMKLQTRYGIPPRAIEAHIHDAGYPWLAIDVKDALGRLTGRVLRWSWLEPNAPIPKTKLFLEGDKRTCAWYGPASYMVFLTEDCLSALRVAENCAVRTAALLGTNFSAATVTELQRAGACHIVLALDPDATETAFEIARKWGPAFNSFRVLVLEKDPKDLPLADLKNIFS